MSSQETKFRWSYLIDIKKLERETNKLLYLGFVISVLVHGLVGVYIEYKQPFRSYRETGREYRRRQIPIKMIFIPQRLTDYYDIRQNVPTEKRPVQKQFGYRIPGIPHLGKRPSSLEAPTVESPVNTNSLVQPIIKSILDAEVSKKIKSFIDPEPFVIERFFTDMKIVRDPYNKSQRLSLKDELINVDDLDTGKYMGVVVQDQNNKQNVEGFIHIPSAVWGVNLTPPDTSRRAIEGLSEALVTYSGIKLHIDGQVQLQSPALSKYPFIYIAADDAFDLSDGEIENLGNYLENGGFAFVEAYGFLPGLPHFMPKGAAPLRKMMKDVLGSKGRIQPIPNDNILYHCYYDFNDGPPFIVKQLLSESAQPADILEGVWMDDRLVAIYSEKGYGASWSRIDVEESIQKIGINIVVLALIQRGGISLKVVDDIAYTR